MNKKKCWLCKQLLLKCGVDVLLNRQAAPICYINSNYGAYFRKTADTVVNSNFI